MILKKTRTGKIINSFTLVEIVMVMAIMAIIFSTVTIVTDRSIRKARDTKRIADMKILMGALELFYDDHGRYPSIAAPDNIPANGQYVGMGGAIDVALRPYVGGVVPQDPSHGRLVAGSIGYYYAYDPEHYVDWCDSDPANDIGDNNPPGEIGPPVLGFRRAESRALQFHKDTCHADSGSLMQAAGTTGAAYTAAFLLR